MDNANFGGIDKYLNKITHGDCIEIMRELPDKCIDLILTDPPYGGSCEAARRGRFNKYEPGAIKARRTGQGWAEKYGSKVRKWDIAPENEYFEEMFRVSKNQIIWGGNYFVLPPTRCFLVWDKLTISENFSMAMCEYAWTSFNSNAKRFECSPQDKYRFHPTQKPLKLFEWCITRYSKENDIILDCYGGSGTTAIAAYNQRRRFICIEKDFDYYTKAVERLEDVTAQRRLF